MVMKKLSATAFRAQFKHEVTFDDDSLLMPMGIVHGYQMFRGLQLLVLLDGDKYFVAHLLRARA